MTKTTYTCEAYRELLSAAKELALTPEDFLKNIAFDGIKGYEVYDASGFTPVKATFKAAQKKNGDHILKVSVTIDIEDWYYGGPLSKKFGIVLSYLIAKEIGADPDEVEVKVRWVESPARYDEDGLRLGRFGCSCC